MKGNVFCPDVETYTKSAVASLGRTNETTGYWIHGLQVRLQQFDTYLPSTTFIHCSLIMRFISLFFGLYYSMERAN